MILPSREDFRKFVRIQASGLCSMLTEEAIKATGLSREVYYDIVDNYSKLAEEYPEVIEEENEPY